MMRQYSSIVSLTVCLLIFLFSLRCIYSPVPQDVPGDSDDDDQPKSTKAAVYAINPQQQTCNPSISQDEIKYPACMLWLNLSGNLAVKVDSLLLIDTKDTYNLTNVDLHDRLTVIDTSNTVRWFIKKNKLGIVGHIQDPEWTTHPNYIGFLGGISVEEEGAYDGLAIRLSDKAYLRFCDKKLMVESTPHLWIPDSAIHGATVASPAFDQETGFVTRDDCGKFFGTTNVRIAYAVPKSGILTIYYIDYTQQSPKPVALLKPEGRELWRCESPLISPDGNWVTYNCIQDIRTNEVYIQRLAPDAQPVLIASNGYEPHWWLDSTTTPCTYQIIYATSLSGTNITADLKDPSFMTSGSAGSTYKQLLRGSPKPGLPSHLGLRPDAGVPPEPIVSLPFKGGLSRSGRFLCTGYRFTYLARLN